MVDEAQQFSVQANLMDKPSVWPAMAAAYRETKGDLATRMLAALEAAEREGGDIRGRQSAALVVVRARPTGKPWEDRLFDLRVEDHANPVSELRRLVQLARAYHHMNAGDLAIEKKDFESAEQEYAAAEALAPHVVEMPFWHAVALANSGKLDEALPIFKRVFKLEPKWADVVPRLVKAELLPKDEESFEKILKQRPGP
jgi:uncharacterized Ntn-hydrolase superfamily protein